MRNYLNSLDQLNSSIKLTISDLLGRRVHENSTGWIDCPKADTTLIKQIAEDIKVQSDTLVVVGTGGSYLGAAAMIEALGIKSTTEVIFVGYSLGSSRLREIIGYLADRDFSINIISKSGSTLETNVVGEVFLDILKSKYPANYTNRVIITTSKGSKMDQLASSKGYATLYIPDDVGGRYSVTTAVGLLPMAVAGLDIDSFLAGARDSIEQLNYDSEITKVLTSYIRYRLLSSGLGKNVELLVVDDERLLKLADWLQQLIAESLGKSKLGCFPAPLLFSRDLHSVGQYIQDGTPNVSETVITISHPSDDDILFHDERDYELFSGIEGCGSINEINRSITESALEAHYRIGVPIYSIEINTLNEYNLGSLITFFEVATASLGILMEINPFDQPAVEAYKKIMRDKYPER